MSDTVSNDAPEVIPWERFQKEAERGLDISVYITSMNAHILNQRDEINRLRPAAESWESYVAARERKGEKGATQAPLASKVVSDQQCQRLVNAVMNAIDAYANGPSANAYEPIRQWVRSLGSVENPSSNQDTERLANSEIPVESREGSPESIDLAREYIANNKSSMGVNAILSVKGFARWLDERRSGETPSATGVSPSPLAQAILERVTEVNVGLFLTGAIDHIEKGGNTASGQVELRDGTLVELRMQRVPAVKAPAATDTTDALAERLNAEIDRLDWDSTAADAVGADECVRFDDAVIKILKRIRGDKPAACSTDPNNCPENEGRGCACSPPKTPPAPGWDANGSET